MLQSKFHSHRFKPNFFKERAKHLDIDRQLVRENVQKENTSFTTNSFIEATIQFSY